MNVYVNNVTGLDDAIVALRMSKRTWNRDNEEKIRNLYDEIFDRNGRQKYGSFDTEMKKYIDQVLNIGKKHVTILRYIDISVTVEGLHRAGQDDWDSHAKRFENRIVRSSTRLAEFGYELSDFYKGRVIPTDVALSHLGLDIPEKLNVNGKEYVKTINGYILETEKDNQDVKRGLYMLSIPSNFIFKVNLCEFAHVFKMRNIDSHANPEVKEVAESICSQLSEFIYGLITREYIMEIDN